METSIAPLTNRFAAIHRGLPAHLQTFHKRLEELEVDDVVFDNEHIDRRNCAIEKARRGEKGTIVADILLRFSRFL